MISPVKKKTNQTTTTTKKKKQLQTIHRTSDSLKIGTSRSKASLVAQLVKNPPAVWETWV